MNIFNKVTLQSMKKGRTRTIVTIIGVILSAAMITGVATFCVSLLNYMTRGAIQKEGDWHVGFIDVPYSFVDERNNDKEVEDITSYENIGYASLEGSKNSNKPYLFVTGFNDKTFSTLPIKLISGRLPENSSEVIISLAVLANGGVKFNIGDILSLNVGNRMNGESNLNQHNPYLPQKETLVVNKNKTYKVVGICQRPSFEEVSAPGYTLITKSDSQEVSDNLSVFVKLKNPYNIDKYVKNKTVTESYIYNDHVLRFMGLSEDKIFNALVYSVGGIVVAIIMIGSIFLIHNSFNISLNERIHQFGILSSIGATAKQLRNSVLFEGFCIGIIGIPIGVILGIEGTRAVIFSVSTNFRIMFYSDVSLDLTISPLAIIVAAVVSMITILISAYIPARKAANTPVIESIKQTKAVKIESKDMEISKLVQNIFGLEGTLALKNFKRNKKRYRSIVLSLVLSMILFISTNSFVIDFKQALEKSKVAVSYDVGIVTQNIDDNKMIKSYEKFKNIQGVYESSYQALGSYSAKVKESELSDSYLELMRESVQGETVDLPMKIQFIEDSEYENIIKNLGLSLEEYKVKNNKIIAVAKMRDKDNAAKELHDMSNMFKNTSMEFDIIFKGNGSEKEEGRQKLNVTFVEIVPPDILPIESKSKIDDNNEYFFRMMAPYSLKKQIESDDKHIDVKGLTFKSKELSKTVDEMKTIIQDIESSSDYTLYNSYEAVSENRNIIFILNIFSYIFIIMISLIAVANVFNTISTNIKLRKRELAMLRSVGMSDHDFQKMMNFECVFYGIKALIIGLPLSIAASLIIYKGMYAGGADNISFTFPWQSIVISIFVVLFVVFITMLYSVSKIKKENIIDILRDDMN